MTAARGPPPRDRMGRRSELQAAEALVEARHLAAAVDDAVLAGPRRVRLRVNLETDHRALLAVGRASGVLAAIGHDDLDLVVIGMDVGLHRVSPPLARLGSPDGSWSIGRRVAIGRASWRARGGQ